MTSERMVNWADRIAYRLIRRAATRAPDGLSDRLKEEWLADLADREGGLSRLRFAVGCCWATHIIAHDRELGLLPAAAGPVSGAGLGAGSSLPPAWRRTAAFVVVAGLHVAVFYAFVIGLNPVLHLTRMGPSQLVPVPVVREDPLPPVPPPRTDYKRPAFDYPMPDFRAPTDEPTVVTPDQPPVTKSIVPDPGARSLDTPAPTVKHVMGGPGSGFPVPDDYYPSRSIYAGETGTATMKVCVDRKGHLTSAPSIEQSTGYARLDAGAINLAKAGSGHYRPSTDDGRPVDSCYDFRVRFNLKN